MSDIKKIREELKWYIEKSEELKLGHCQLSYNYWCLARTAVDKTGVLGFIDTLAVFIKQERVKAKKIDNAKNKQCKKGDLS